MDKLNKIQLRDKRQADVLKFTAMPEDIMEDMRNWFAHKGPPWMWHLEQWHKGLTTGMDAHFYLAMLDGRLIGNITVFRNGVFGNVAHVFTAPDSRKLGVAKALLEAVIADFEQDGGQVLVLSSKFNGFEWRLYESAGFLGIYHDDKYGWMIRFLQGADWPDLFKCQSPEIHKLDWRHFVGTQILFGSPGPEQIRSIHLPCIGRRFVEEQFLRFKLWQADNADSNAWVIQGHGHCVLGFVAVRQHPMWGEFGRRKVLDLFFHPSGLQMARPLLETVLENTSEPLECYCDSTAEQKIALLRDLGFKESRIPSAFSCGGQLLDLVLCMET
jgi:GNAT superfamily N-acetyltransferase